MSYFFLCPYAFYALGLRFHNDTMPQQLIPHTLLLLPDYLHALQNKLAHVLGKIPSVIHV